MSGLFQGGWVEWNILPDWRFTQLSKYINVSVEFNIVQAKQGHMLPYMKVLTLILCHILHGWWTDIINLWKSPSIGILAVVVFRWPHIHWWFIQFNVPSSNSEDKATSVSLSTTIDYHKNEMCFFKCKDSKDITDSGKEDLHL